MRKLFLSFLLASVPVSALLPQDAQTSKNHNNLKLAFEFGTNVIGSQLAMPEQIRENQSSAYLYNGEYEHYAAALFGENNELSTTYFGIKPEYFIFNNRIGIASGLRFTMASSKLVFNQDDLLWKLKEDGLHTDYVRISNILQDSYLLGIPFEIRFFPNKRELPFQHYVKIGTSLNYHIYSDNQVVFTNNAMEKYKDVVLNQLSENNVFSSFVFGAVGFKIGKFREGCWVPWGNIEFQFPYMLLTNKSFVFAGRGGSFPGVGIQCSFEIPIGKNVPIGKN